MRSFLLFLASLYPLAALPANADIGTNDLSIRRECRKQQLMVMDAVTSWAMVSNVREGTAIDANAVVQYLNYRRIPRCPQSRKEIAIPFQVGDCVQCPSFPEHTFPFQAGITNKSSFTNLPAAYLMDDALYQIHELSIGVEAYCREKKAFPDELNTVLPLIRHMFTAVDPWGVPLALKNDDKSARYSITSAGPDREFNTPDDVSREYAIGGPTDPRQIWDSNSSTITQRYEAAMALVPTNATYKYVVNLLGQPTTWFRTHGIVLGGDCIDESGLEYRFHDGAIWIHFTDYTRDEDLVFYKNKMEIVRAKTGKPYMGKALSSNDTVVIEVN